MKVVFLLLFTLTGKTFCEFVQRHANKIPNLNLSPTVSSLSLSAPSPSNYHPSVIIDDGFLSSFDSASFSKKDLENKLDSLSNSFSQCLLMRGVKTESFEKCTGSKYSKVGDGFRRVLTQGEMIIRKEFGAETEAICKVAKNCSTLDETLRASFVNEKSPVRKLRIIMKRSSLSEDQRQNYKQILAKLQKNLNELSQVRKLTLLKKNQTVAGIIKLIKAMKVKQDYDFKHNPFYISPAKERKLKRKLYKEDEEKMKEKLKEYGAPSDKIRY